MKFIINRRRTNHAMKTAQMIRQCGLWATIRNLQRRGYDFEMAYWAIFQRAPTLRHTRGD